MQSLRICWRRCHIIQRIALRFPCWQNGSSSARRTIKSSPPARARRQHDDYDDTEDDDFKVNYFEQDDPSPNAKRRRIDPSERDEEDEELEAGLKVLEEGLEDTEIPDQMSMDQARQLFSEEQLEKIAAIKEESPIGGIGDILPHQISTDRMMPRQSLLYLDKLNEALDEANLNTSIEKVGSTLWRWYNRSKSNVPDLVKIVPKAGWDLLWATQSTGVGKGSSRLSHLKTLAEDKESAGWELSREEQYALLEGKFFEGDRLGALKQWESRQRTEDWSNPEFLEMGLRMYARFGEPVKAEQLLDKCSGVNTTSNPRLAIPVLRSYSKLGGTENSVKAWTLYQRMREKLGSHITMTDFDVVSLSFLADGHKDFALAVFRDMMLCGQPEDQESKGLYEQAMRHISYYMQGGNGQQVTSFSLDAVKYLPRRFQNKYFYASWLRKLISEGNVNAAAQVVELMYERGVRPDARPINGLINAWFRQGVAHGRQRGEEMAWAMIQERIDFAKQRRSQKSAQPIPQVSVHVSDENIHIPTFVQRPVPLATVETFGILGQHYISRGMFDHVRYLRNLLASAELQMNSFFMNHLLYVEQRTHGYEGVWTRYELMSRYVRPDMQTWACLWESAKRLIDRRRSQFVEGFPPPRDMFRQMMLWMRDLRGQERVIAQDEMNMYIYHDIIRSFCLASDLEGSIIVMQAVKTTFGVYPDERTVRVLLMQVARLSQGKARPNTARRRGRSLVVRNREALETPGMTEALKVFNIIREGRLKEYENNGYQFETLEASQQSEENYRVCLTFLYTIVRRRLGDRFKDNGFVMEAMDQMGVEQFDIDEAMDLIEG